MKVAYLAGPYRPTNGRTIRHNIRSAERVALRYWKRGVAVICPHLNTAFFDGEAPDELWLRGDMAILRKCDLVIMMTGWEKSPGATAEREEAMRIGLPVVLAK